MIAVLKSRDANGSIGAWQERIRNAHRIASTGEAAVLHAFLYAIDYGWLAEELAHEHGRPFLTLFERTAREFRLGCLARCDGAGEKFHRRQVRRLAAQARNMTARRAHQL